MSRRRTNHICPGLQQKEMIASNEAIMDGDRQMERRRAYYCASTWDESTNRNTDSWP
jgi:hypothetical protein